MPARRSVLVLAALAVGVAPASADPVPAPAEEWPRCGSAPDDDGRYCVEELTVNGVSVPEAAPDGVSPRPSVDLVGDGVVRFGVARAGVAEGEDAGDVPAGDVYRFVVNTGAIVPRELTATARDVRMAVGGGPATGYRLTLTLRPTPIAWTLAPPGCAVGACTDGLVADTVRDGFVAGSVSDLADWVEVVPGERAMRRGLVQATSAQDANPPVYEPAPNTLRVDLANPGFRRAGEPVNGTYETFLPDAVLRGLLGVAAPSGLTARAFRVLRVGGGAVPFTLTRQDGGVRVEVRSLTAPSLRLRIGPRPRVPDAPVILGARRLAGGLLQVRFAPPRNTGGAPVLGYVARCAAPGGGAVTRRRTGSPIQMRGLAAARGVSCTVRAVNRLGAGPLSRRVRALG